MINPDDETVNRFVYKLIRLSNDDRLKLVLPFYDLDKKDNSRYIMTISVNTSTLNVSMMLGPGFEKDVEETKDLSILSPKKMREIIPEIFGPWIERHSANWHTSGYGGL